MHGRDRKVVGEKTNKRIKLILIIMFDYSWLRDYLKRYLPKHGVKKSIIDLRRLDLEFDALFVIMSCIC